jgi:ketosteroid isomerase-like protein
MADPGRNVETVQRVFEAGRDYIRGDRDGFREAVRELCREDIVAVPSSALASGSAGPFRGREGVLRQQEAIASLWPDFDMLVDDFVDVPPSTVVILGKVAASRANGVGYAVELGMVWRVEGGQIVSVHSFESKRRALEEAGATELPPRGGSE